MSEERRKRSTDRPGRRRPGAPPGGRSADRKQSPRPRPDAAPDRSEDAGRSRFTGRMAVLVLVLAVLAVSYASSLRAYLQQRSHIDSLEQEIAQTTAEIDALEREKERWEDPEYVAQQARVRFGYVEPGETPFVVVDEDGKPLGGAELSEPSEVPLDEQPAWYDVLWESTGVAGNPPTELPTPPAGKIADDEGNG